MEKNYKDQMAERAAKLVEEFDRLKEECRDLAKICRENPEEYAELVGTLSGYLGSGKRFKANLGRAIQAIFSRSENRAKDWGILAVERGDVDFEGSMVKGKGKTVYFSSLMV